MTLIFPIIIWATVLLDLFWKISDFDRYDRSSVDICHVNIEHVLKLTHFFNKFEQFDANNHNYAAGAPENGGQTDSNLFADLKLVLFSSVSI